MTRPTAMIMAGGTGGHVFPALATARVLRRRGFDIVWLGTQRGIEARLVPADYEFHGCPMKENEWVLLPFPAANRDPEAFDEPDTFVIDRAENRHAAFGLGIHRCLGSNLARLELRVAVQEFVARFPDFELAGEVRWSAGQIRGPRQLPVRILSTS